MSDEHHDHHHNDGGINPVAARGCGYLSVFLAFVAFGCIAPILFMLDSGYAPAVPVLTVFGEPIQKDVWVWPIVGGNIINTMTALIVVDVIILLIVFQLRELSEIPRGFQNGFEALFSFLYEQTKAVAGAADGRKIFPIVASMFLIVLVANWTKLIPGYESVGALHCAEQEDIVTMSGYPIHGVDLVGEDWEDGELEQADLPSIVFLMNDEVFNNGTSATHDGYQACNFKYFHKEEYRDAYYGSDGEIDLHAEDAHDDEHADDEHADDSTTDDEHTDDAAVEATDDGHGDDHHFGVLGVPEHTCCNLKKKAFQKMTCRMWSTTWLLHRSSVAHQLT